MVKYGKIEDGVLRSREVEAYPERYQETKKGVTQVKERIISVAEQTAELEKQGWKPLDEIDESKLECNDGFAVRIVAVEYEDHIGYEYEKVINPQYYRNKIQDLKNELASTDYKVIKCYEASLVGEAMPYDTQELHTSRQYIRDSINALEDMLDNIVKDQSGNTGD